MGNAVADGPNDCPSVRALAAALAWLTTAVPSWSASANDRPDAHFSVVARVIHRARLETASTAAPIQISSEDLRRGRLVVRRTYSVETTSGDAPVLRMTPLPPLLESLEVRTFGTKLRTLDTELEIVPPVGRPFTVEYELYLAEGVLPGTYPLPVHVDLVPLHRVDPSVDAAEDPDVATHLVRVPGD